MTNTPRLLIIDCDGVLYHPSEFDINAMVYSFNDVCDYFDLQNEKFNYVYDCTQDKPIKGFFNYIAYVAKKAGVKTEDFILKMVAHIDYSQIKPDNEELLQKLIALGHKYKVCICTNNHIEHLNNVLKAKFNITADELPFEVFDMHYGMQDGVFHQKESLFYISKLEQHFGIPARDFLWIDDSPNIIEKIKSFGSQVLMVTDENRLSDILEKL